jgi:hypothetical protein
MRETLLRVHAMHASGDVRLVPELLEYIRWRAVFDSVVADGRVKRRGEVQVVIRALHAAAAGCAVASGASGDEGSAGAGVQRVVATTTSADAALQVVREALGARKRGYRYPSLRPWAIRFSFDELPPDPGAVRNDRVRPTDLLGSPSRLTAGERRVIMCAAWRAKGMEEDTV